MRFPSKSFNLGRILSFTGPAGSILVVAILALPLLTRAATVFNEPFNYTNGPLVTVSGGI